MAHRPGVWSRWAECLAIVQPGTVIAWHRRGFARWWAWKPRRVGRPPLAPELNTCRSLAQGRAVFADLEDLPPQPSGGNDRDRLSDGANGDVQHPLRLF